MAHKAVAVSFFSDAQQADNAFVQIIRRKRLSNTLSEWYDGYAVIKPNDKASIELPHRNGMYEDIVAVKLIPDSSFKHDPSDLEVYDAYTVISSARRPKEIDIVETDGTLHLYVDGLNNGSSAP